MKLEDKQAIRIFYQTMAGTGGASTPQQIDFYFRVLKGTSVSRKAWLKDNAAAMNLPPSMQILITNMDSVTKADLAVIAGAQVGAMIAPKVQSIFTKAWNFLFGWMK